MFGKIILGMVIVLSSFFFNFPASAKNKEVDINSENLPEQSGIYSVRGNPNLILRVFVHNSRDVNRAKPVPPTPTPIPDPVCNLSDPGSDTVSSITPWRLPSNFPYWLNSESVPSSVGKMNLYEITNNGFQEWTSAINNKIAVEYAGTTSQNKARYDRQNIISWGRASSGTLGVTYIWYSSGVAVEIDTIMNKLYPWSWSDPSSWNNTVCAYPNSYDAQNILTHELGHWFGVDDDYENDFQNNTMYGYGDVMETKKDTLTNGDIQAVNNIYH